MKKLRDLGPYTLHTDPGHAWIEVPFRDVYLLGIGNDLSKLSFMNEDGTILYLEEDSDAIVFLQAWRQLQPPESGRSRRPDGTSCVLVRAPLGWSPHFVTEHTDEASFIRGLRPLDWEVCLDEYRERLRAAVIKTGINLRSVNIPD